MSRLVEIVLQRIVHVEVTMETVLSSLEIARHYRNIIGLQVQFLKVVGLGKQQFIFYRSYNTAGFMKTVPYESYLSFPQYTEAGEPFSGNTQYCEVCGFNPI